MKFTLDIGLQMLGAMLGVPPEETDDHRCPLCDEWCDCDGGRDDCECECPEDDEESDEPDWMALAKDEREQWAAERMKRDRV